MSIKVFPNIIYKIVRKLENQYRPEKIILFGSYAWGKATRHSDVDLFIIKKTNRRHIDRSVKVCEILDKENNIVALDPIVYTPDEVNDRLKIGDDFIRRILNKGKILYE